MKIREKLSNRWLRKELKKKTREKNFVNINHAHTLGLIWQEGEEHLVDYLMKLIANSSIKVSKICHSNLASAEVFTKKDYNFWGKPTSQQVKNFIAEPFDILIDLTRNENYEVKATRALSNAKLKVGSSLEELNFLDLNIQVNAEVDSKYLVEQMFFYLSVINNAK